MSSRLEITTKKPNHQIPDGPGPTVDSKKQTIVASYPLASQSTIEIDRNNNDSNIELQATDEASELNQQAWVPYSSELWMVSCFALMALMVSMDALILIPILPNIAQKYHTNPNKNAIWPVTVYFLANASMQRFYVAIMRIFGGRIVLIAGTVLFTMGVILLSAAPTLFPVLLAGRGAQGAGAAAMVSIPHTMLRDIISDNRRSIYSCIILVSSAVGASMGLVLGGIFLQKSTDWRWIFYISAPFCFLILVSTPFIVQPIGEQLEPKRRFNKVDWTGIMLFSGSMVALLLGITWAPIFQKELKWQALFPIVVGAVGMMAMFIYERSGASKPFLPLHVLKISPITYICVFIQSILMAVQVTYIPVYLRRVHDVSPSSCGILLIPLVLTLFVSIAGLGLIPRKLYHFRWTLWLGWALIITSSACLTLFNRSTKRGVCIIVILVTGLAHGVTISATHAALQELSSPEMPQSARDASLIANFIRASGICLGISGAEAVFRTRFIFHNQHSLLLEMYALSVVDLMRVLTVVAGIGGLLSLFVGWRKKV